MVRRLRLWAMRNGIAVLAVILALGYGLSLWKPSPARADATVEKWKTVALSDVALNLRMMALEKIKKDGSESALDALEDIAKRGALPVQMAACAQIGRVHSNASKAKLKGLLEDSGRSTEVRTAAVASIAEHWRDQGDLAYLEGQCQGNEVLSAHCAVVRSQVYGQ